MGGISDQGKTDLIVVQGNMTGQRYIDQILRPVVVPYARNHGPGFQLMDDNARPHRANIVTNFLAAQHINRFLPWPAISPDMNPLEHFWDEGRLSKSASWRHSCRPATLRPTGVG